MPTDAIPAQPSERAEAKATANSAHKKKQLLVVVLLIGLLLAIVTQPDKQIAETEPILEASWASPSEPPPEITSSQVRPPELASLWQKPLDETCELSRISWNEISKSELFAPEPVAARQTPVNAQRRVQAIYGTSTHRAALIGESIVRGGQPLPDGGKVMDVTTEGIQVAD